MIKKFIRNNKYNPDKFDAVADYDYSTRSEEYNEKFIEWRKDKKNPYAYNYSENLKENVFVDGYGFVEKSAEKEERKSLYKVLGVIGTALLISIVIDDFFDKILAFGLNFLGVDIHASFTNSLIYGAKIPVVLVLMLTDILKVAVPLWYASGRFKMPRLVSCPLKINHKLELVTSAAVVFMVGSLLSLLEVYSEDSREIYSFFKSFGSDVPLWHQPEYIMYLVFDVLVFTVVTEMLYRGLFLSVLRQFGDVYAVIVTSVLCGLMTHDYALLPGVMIVSAIASIAVLRSGSILVAIQTRIIYELFFLMVPLLTYEMSKTASLIFSLCCFGFGVLLFFFTYAFKALRTKVIFARYNAQVTLRGRLMLVLTCYPTLAVVLVCIVMGFLE